MPEPFERPTNAQLGEIARKAGDPIGGKMIEMGMLDEFTKLAIWCQNNGFQPHDLQKAVYRAAILNLLPFKAKDVSNDEYMKGCVRDFLAQVFNIVTRIC